MKAHLIPFILLLTVLSGRAADTDPLFYKFPNSGVNFEALYSNPTDGTACVGDFNEDGKPDLIVMGPNYNEFNTSFVNLLLNNGDNTFTRHDLGLKGLNNGSIAFLRTAPGRYLLAIQGGQASPAAANNAIAYTAELRIDNGKIVCSETQRLNYGLFDGDLLFVDFDSDGLKDLVQFGGSRRVYTYRNNNNTGFEFVSNVTGLKGTSKGKSQVYDINSDGKKDIVCIDQSYGLCVYLNNGNNGFTEVPPSLSDYGFKIKPRFEFGDFDKDGKIDLVAFDTHPTSGENRVVFLYGDGTGAFVPGEPNDFPGVNAAAIAVGDFNNDGNPDVLYAGENQKTLLSDPAAPYTKKAYILSGDGARGFTWHIKATPQRQNCDLFSLSPVGNGEYHLADFDGDGKDDLFAIGELGINVPGKLMRRTELFLSSLSYDFGTPIDKPLIKEEWQGFLYSQVRLGEGPLLQAMNKEITYLKSLDINRLFAATLSYNLGIGGHQPYGGWEAEGYGASFAHYLSAVSMAYAVTGDNELLERANRCVEIITASQDYMGDGFFAFKDGTTWGFDKMAKEKIITPYGWDENGHPWGNNGIGFPFYSHHKIFAALRDAYLYTDNEDARIGFIKFNEWLVKWMQNFDTENFQKMLESEHGGMVETLSDAYALSGKQKFLDAAVKFTRDNFAHTMSNNIDDLSGRHSNFHIPMALGASVHYLYSGDVRSGNTARNFFHMVHDHHTLCNGGNGNNERFGTPDLLTYRLGIRGPETCSSYNMLKLAKGLFCREGEVKYLDYYENTLYNHILAILSPRSDAGVCYYLSLKPGTFKMYDNLYNNFWCCVGTGMESHVKYADAIYFKNEKDLLVNLFTPSVLNWKEKGLKLKMETDFPATDRIVLHVEENTGFTGDVVVRYPLWAEKNSITIAVNGKNQPISASPGELIRIAHSWKTGDEIEITINCRLRLVDLPDDVNVSALFYGPILLAANVGEVGQSDVGESSPRSVITNPDPHPYFPSLKISRDKLDTFLEKKPGTLEFTTKGLETNYTLKPFYNTHHCRYNVYWKIGDDADLNKERELIADRVLTGVSESEQHHNVTASGSNTGWGSFNFWGPTYFRFRDAGTTGFISYDLNLLDTELPTDKQYYLQITYFGSEPSGYGNFRIYVDDSPVAYENSISYLAPLDFAQRYYPISRELTNGKKKITVKFSGGRLSLYGLKLTTTPNLVEAKKEEEQNTSIENPDVEEFNIHVINRKLHVINQPGSIIKLYSIEGHTLFVKECPDNHSVFELRVPDGIYIVQSELKERVIAKKIMVR